MKLQAKQMLFTKLVADLLDFAHEDGYEVIFSYAFRCKDCPVGQEKSLHKKCLAIDLELFRDGKYLTETEDHRPLGDYWESLHPLCCWGGRFKKEDGNHYSITHNGRK